MAGRRGVPTQGPLPSSASRPGVQLLRFEADDGAAALVRHVWVPLWSLPPGQEVVQEILQYPGGNVVVLAGESGFYGVDAGLGTRALERSEEHTSELQSRGHLVCRLLLEKKNKRRRRCLWANYG